jgi:hypothetical protein
MVEVFKTNVTDSSLAGLLVSEINRSIGGYTANFDLSDCDRILRVKCWGTIDTARVIRLLESHGCCAQVLAGDDKLE